MIPPSQQIDLSAMTVEDSYQGPRLEGAHPSCWASSQCEGMHLVHADPGCA